MNEAPPPKRSGDSAPLDALILRARLSELWERIWPVLVALFVVIGVFLSISWLGLWLHTPAWGRALGLAAFAAALLWPAFLFFRVRAPSRQESLVDGALVMHTGKTRIRIRWLRELDTSCRVRIHRPVERVLAIVGGPAEIGGNRAFIEIMCEEFST